jgi:hypothetical protein
LLDLHRHSRFDSLTIKPALFFQPMREQACLSHAPPSKKHHQPSRPRGGIQCFQLPHPICKSQPHLLKISEIIMLVNNNVSRNVYFSFLPTQPNQKKKEARQRARICSRGL